MTHLGFNTQTFISLLLCEHLISFAIYLPVTASKPATLIPSAHTYRLSNF